MPQFSKRLELVTESASLKLNALAQSLQASGKSVINLTAGEPDFFIDDSVKEAAISAIKQNKSRYTPVLGVLPLREKIIEYTHKFQKEIKEKSPWQPAEVLVSCGAKQSIFNFLLSTVNPGDEVVIISPYWLSYPEMVKVAEGTPRIIDTDLNSGFKVTPAQLKESLNEKTKAVILNSPSNPTGAMYSKQELRALGEVILNSPFSKNIWVVSDEIYDQIVYGGAEYCSFLGAIPELKNQTLTVNGLSKSAAMTGWRMGWSVGVKALISKMSVLQGQSTSGINSVTQWAGIAALNLKADYFAKNVEVFKKKRDRLLDILQKSSKIKSRAPDGAFYAFVDVGAVLKPGENAGYFAEKLLEAEGVVVVPGTAFGADEFIRLSFATDMETLEIGCEKIVSFVNTI